MSTSTPQSNKIIASMLNTTGGIRKTLLTPCRRIGLSRNRKTTSFVSPLETNEIKLPSANIQVNEVQNSEKLCPTPNVDHKRKQQFKSVTDKSKDEIHIENVEPKLSPNIKEAEHGKIKVLKETNRKINKNNTKSNLKDNNCKEICASAKKELNTDIKIKKGKLNSFNSEDSNDSDVVRTSKACHKVATKKKRKNYIADSDEDYPFRGFVGTSVQDNSISTQFEIKKRKRIIVSSQESDSSAISNQSKLSMKCENSNIREINDENSLESTSYQENTDHILDEFCDSGSNNTTPTSTKIIPNKTIFNGKSTPKLKSDKGVKRKLSLKKSLSNTSSVNEDDTVLSTSQEANAIVDVFKNMQDMEIIEEIMKLEKTIQDKESHLQKMQQAEIYRNIHKLDNMKSDTDVWKIGCQAALRDLLMKLNEHNSIDMITMLTNLNVPQDIFKYDPDNDCFL